MKITKRFVDGLELPQKGKVAVFWDDDLKGFGLKVTVLSKIYIVQYRVAGVIVRYTIGKHGAYTPDQAREEAREIIRKMSQGINPNAAKRMEKEAAKTLRDAVDGYLIDHDLKESSKADIRKHFEKNFTAWRDLPLTEISRQMVQDRFREISLRSKSQANQAFRNLRAWFNYAAESFRIGGEKLLDENPVDVLAGAKMWHSIEPKNRRIPLDKLGAVVELLHHVRHYPGTSLAGQSQADAILFAIVSGGRWGEVSRLKWEHVDLDAGFWFISAPKNRRPVRLPLPQQAIGMLKDRPRINDFVFCSNKAGTGHVSTGRWMTDQITKLIGAEISPHDLRRTFRSIAAECHIELWRTKLLMNHAVNGDVTLASYTEKENLEYLRPDVQRIADYVTGCHDQAKARADNVVPFPGVAK